MIEIENGKRSNLPPAEKTELIAAIPAPIIIPDFMAEGIEKTTSFAHLITPKRIVNNQSIS